EFELEPAHVIGFAAQRIGNLRLGDGIERGRCTSGVGALVILALDPGADAADVEAAKLGPEEAVGQADRVPPRSRRGLQCLDVAALGMGRENPAAAKTLVLGRIGARAEVPNVAAKAGKVLRERHALTPCR